MSHREVAGLGAQRDDTHVRRVRERARHGVALQALAGALLDLERPERGERIAVHEEARGDAGEGAQPLHQGLVEGVGRRDETNGEAPAVEWGLDALEARDRLGALARHRDAQRVRRAAEIGERAIERRRALALRLGVVRGLVEARGDGVAERARRSELRAGGVRELHVAEVAGLGQERAAERAEILVERAPPGGDVVPLRGGAERHDAVPAARTLAGPRPAVELVEAVEHLVRPHLERERLVGDLGELVHLVDDRVLEARVVGRPAQQEVVVRDDEVRLRERGAAPAERTPALPGALLARAELGARGDRAAQQLAQRGVAAHERGRHGARPRPRRASARRPRAPRAPRAAPGRDRDRGRAPVSQRAGARTRSSRGP